MAPVFSCLSDERCGISFFHSPAPSLSVQRGLLRRSSSSSFLRFLNSWSGVSAAQGNGKAEAYPREGVELVLEQDELPHRSDLAQLVRQLFQKVLLDVELLLRAGGRQPKNAQRAIASAQMRTKSFRPLISGGRVVTLLPSKSKNLRSERLQTSTGNCVN